MFNLYELEALNSFAECGTLSKAAQELHISQPTLTREMQHIEAEFGVKLFTRSKNHIELNETGRFAASQVKALLNQANNMTKEVKDYDLRLHTITVESCAPAPLWSLLPALTSLFPDSTISSRIRENEEIVANLQRKECRVGVLSGSEILKMQFSDSEYQIIPYIQENLYLSVKKDHPLAQKKEITFKELNGMTFLVRSELGFWGHLHKTMMPKSNFIQQQDENTLYALLQESEIPGFVTNISMQKANALQNRSYIEIAGPEAHVIFYLVFRRDDIIASQIQSLEMGKENG